MISAGWIVLPSRLGADELAALATGETPPSALATHEAALAIVRELVGAGEDDERFMVDEAFHRAELPTQGPAAMAHWGSSEPSYFAGALGQRFSSGLRLVAALADAPAGAGGVVLVPCSHRAANPVPLEARSGEVCRSQAVGRWSRVSRAPPMPLA